MYRTKPNNQLSPRARKKSYGLLKPSGLANVNGCTFSLIYNNSPTEQLSLDNKSMKKLHFSNYNDDMNIMVLDKKSPIFLDALFKNVTIIISACPSVTKKTLFFNFFNMNFLHV